MDNYRIETYFKEISKLNTITNISIQHEHEHVFLCFIILCYDIKIPSHRHNQATSKPLVNSMKQYIIITNSHFIYTCIDTQEKTLQNEESQQND